MNTLDIIFILIIVFFALIALAKGFIRELFGKVCVIGSIAICLFFAPKLVTLILRTIENLFLANILGYLLVFVASFLAIRIIQTLVEEAFDCDIMTSLNMTLGFILGALEGFVIVMLAILLLEVQPIIKTATLDSFMEGSFFCTKISPIVRQEVKSLSTLPPSKA